jgi:putative addiction module component (TIGR02574 family)
MSQGVQDLLQAALALSDEEQLQLIAALTSAIDERGLRPFDVSWLEEIRRRSAEHDAGSVRPIPWAEVKERARRPVMVDVAFLPAAQADYLEAINWYEDRREAASTGFQAAVEVALRAIGEAPERRTTCDERHRFYVLRRYPYASSTASRPRESWWSPSPIPAGRLPTGRIEAEAIKSMEQSYLQKIFYP